MKGPLVVCFDMDTRLIDKMRVMHARGTSRHAAKAGKAAIHMMHGFRGRQPTFFQHLLDHVNAPTRAVAFIACQHISGASSGAKAAMDA